MNIQPHLVLNSGGHGNGPSGLTAINQTPQGTNLQSAELPQPGSLSRNFAIAERNFGVSAGGAVGPAGTNSKDQAPTSHSLLAHQQQQKKMSGAHPLTPGAQDNQSLLQSQDYAHQLQNHLNAIANHPGKNQHGLMNSTQGATSNQVILGTSNNGQLGREVSPHPPGSQQPNNFLGASPYAFNNNLNTSNNRNPIEGQTPGAGAGGSGMQSQIKLSRVSGRGTAADRSNAFNINNQQQPINPTVGLMAAAQGMLPGPLTNHRVRATTNDPREIQGMGKKLVGLGYGAQGNEMSPDHVTTEVKEKFQKYLRLIFTDLCAKDNGLNMRTFGIYTFQKYARSLPGFLSKRLYHQMASDKVDSEQIQAIMQSQNGAGGPQAQKKSGQKTKKLLLAERDKFIKTIMAIYSGSSSERRSIIFKMLDTQNRGQVSKSQVRVALYHMLQFRDCLAGFGKAQDKSGTIPQSTSVVGPSGFSSILLYLIERIRIESMTAFKTHKGERIKALQACKEILTSFHEMQLGKDAVVGSAKDNEQEQKQLLDQQMEQVTRQRVIEYLVEDIFTNPRVKSKQRSGDISLTLDDFVGIQAAPAPNPINEQPIGLFELFMVFYLKLLLPCADYFEQLMFDHYQKCEKYKQEDYQRRLNQHLSHQNPAGNQRQAYYSELKGDNKGGQSGIANGAGGNGVVKQFQSDRFLNKNLSRSGAVMGGGFTEANKQPIQNSHTLHLQHSLVHSRSQLKFKGKGAYPTQTQQSGLGRVGSHIDQNPASNTIQNIQSNALKAIAQRQKTLGFVNNLKHSHENTGSDHLQIQGAPGNMRSVDLKNAQNLRGIGGGVVAGSQSQLNSWFNAPHNILAVPPGRSQAAILNNVRVHSEQSRAGVGQGSESGFNSQNEESKADGMSPNPISSPLYPPQNKIGPSKFRESFNKVLAGQQERGRSPNARELNNAIIGRRNVNQENSLNKNSNFPEKEHLEEQDSGDIVAEEESLLGLTQVQDGDEFRPTERLNVPYVNDLHSNFHAMRKNNESALIDSTLGKLIIGNQGPFQIARPQILNMNSASGQTMFQTREIIYDMMASNNLGAGGASHVSSLAGGSFLMLRMIQNRKSQLIQSKCGEIPNYYDAQSNAGMPNGHGGGPQKNPSGERSVGMAFDGGAYGMNPNFAMTLQQQQQMQQEMLEDQQEGESLIGMEDDQDAVINFHRRAILLDASMVEHLNRIYRKLVIKRYQERKNALESQISACETHAWEVIFKVPDGEGEDKANKDKAKQQPAGNGNVHNTQGAMSSHGKDNNGQINGGKQVKRFFIKVEGHDVYCVHEPHQRIDTPKLKFLHCLLGCSFQIKPPEDPSYLKYFQNLQNKQLGVSKSGAKGNEGQDSEENANLSVGQNGVVVQSNVVVHGSIVQNGVQQIPVQMCHQIQIKLSEKHKRVFYVKSKELANEVVKRLRIAAGAREVEEYYGQQNSQMGKDNTTQTINKEGSSGVNNPQENILGQGTYGKVYKAFSRTTGKPVAIKQINKKALILEELELQQHEIHLYRVMTDDNYKGTVRMLDVFEDHLQINVVLEFIEGKNLFHWIKSEKEVDEEKSRRLFREIVKVVGYVHSKGIVHRDIKLENIMLRQLPPSDPKLSAQQQESAKGKLLLQPKPTEDLPMEDYGGADPEFQVRLIDFGLSKVLIPGETSTDPYGTLAYCSPEIIAKRPHTQQTDVWSLGIVLYTLLTRRMPFVVSHDVEQTKNNILYRALNFENPLWQTVSEEAKDLLARMLEKDQRNRISCEGALRHPWLAKGTALAKDASYKGNKSNQYTEKRSQSGNVPNRVGSSYLKAR